MSFNNYYIFLQSEGSWFYSMLIKISEGASRLISLACFPNLQNYRGLHDNVPFRWSSISCMPPARNTNQIIYFKYFVTHLMMELRIIIRSTSIVSIFLPWLSVWTIRDSVYCVYWHFRVYNRNLPSSSSCTCNIIMKPKLFYTRDSLLDIKQKCDIKHHCTRIDYNTWSRLKDLRIAKLTKRGCHGGRNQTVRRNDRKS